jgi:hypothetical protein
MIVDQFHVTRRPILEAKNNAPVGAYGNGPKAFELSLKRVQPQSRQVDILDHTGRMDIGENDRNPLNEVRPDQFAVIVLEQASKALVIEADIPEQYGVDNVYGDLGQVIAMTLVGQPHLCAATLGILLRGLGPERICWGTDALWTGSPQWQIEGLRRLEIPEEMQKKYGFKPLGIATGPVKAAIFSGNNGRLYDIDLKKAELQLRNDQFAQIKAEYKSAGTERSNLRYGYMNNNALA